jgi:branched-chain amino acid transport system substrate-binding protein
MSNKVYLGLAVTVMVAVLSGCDIQNTNQQQTVKEPIKIGAILPLTGKAAVYGQRMKNGYELARAEINANGGINGRPLEIIYEDSAGETANAVTAAEKMISTNGIKILFGGLSNEVNALFPLTENKKVLLVIPAAGGENLVKQGGYSFKLRESGDDHGAKAAEAAISFGYKKAAVLYVNNENGISYALKFIEKFKELGGQITYSDNYAKSEVDFRTQLVKIKIEKPDVIYIPGYAKDLAQIIKQANTLKVETKYISSPGIEGPELFDAIDSRLVEDVVYTYPYYNPKDSAEQVKKFADAYLAGYGQESEFISANCYDALNLIGLSLKSCGEDNECISRFMFGVQDYPGVGGLTTITDSGNVMKPVMLKVIKDGQFVPYK